MQPGRSLNHSCTDDGLPWCAVVLDRGCVTWRVLGVAKEAAAGRHWKWQSFLRPTLLVEAEVQLLLLLWLASCPQAVITILGVFMLLFTVIVVCARSHFAAVC